MTVEKILEEVQAIEGVEGEEVKTKLLEVFNMIKLKKDVKGTRDAGFMWQIDQYIAKLEGGG